MKLTNSRVIGICLIISASVLTASASQADTDTLTACVKKSNGAARIISGKMKCYRGERLVTWTSTSDSLIGPAGAKGATGAEGPAGATGPAGAVGPAGVAGPAGRDGVNGTNGVNGLDGAVGATGAQGIQGPAGAAGPAGADGIDGVNGISKALVATVNQISINQGSSKTLMNFIVPAGKYALSLGAGISYSNAGIAMAGYANLDCFLTSSSNYPDAAINGETNYWPITGNGTPNKITFENHSATSDQVMRRSFGGNGLLIVENQVEMKFICRHHSSVVDHVGDTVTFYNLRAVLTAVSEIVTLN